MNRLTLFAALALLLPACEPPPAAPPPPGTYVDPEGRFTAHITGGLETTSSSENLPQGGVMSTTSVSTKDDVHIFMITAMKLTGLPGYDCEKGLSGMRDNTIKNLGCTTTSDAPLQVGGHTARDVKFECATPAAKGVLRLVCDDSKMAASHEAHAYSVLARFNGAAWNEAEANGFVTSFVLK